MVELKKILDAKKVIMGIAMIMIMIFHCSLPVINGNVIKSNLYIGVDLFLFVSGLGIAQSLNNNKDIKSFYKKRFMRIVPPTLPLIIILGFLMLIYDNDYSIIDFYSHSFLLHLFIGKGNQPAFLWYIPAILIYYLISPVIYNFYEKRNNKIKASIIIYTIAMLFVIITIPQGALHHLHFITDRLIIYITGLLYGIRIIENKNMCKWELAFYTAMSVISLAFIHYVRINALSYLNDIKIISFTPIAIILCIIISYLYSFLKNNRGRIITNIFEFIGTYTLIIYTTHESFQFIVRAICCCYNKFMNFILNPYIYSLVISLFTIVFSIIYTKIYNYILRD